MCSILKEYILKVRIYPLKCPSQPSECFFHRKQKKIPTCFINVFHINYQITISLERIVVLPSFNKYEMILEEWTYNKNQIGVALFPKRKLVNLWPVYIPQFWRGESGHEWMWLRNGGWRKGIWHFSTKLKVLWKYIMQCDALPHKTVTSTILINIPVSAVKGQER